MIHCTKCGGIISGYGSNDQWCNCEEAPVQEPIIIGRFANNKGATINDHIKWIDKELAPPAPTDPGTIYILKCFRECLVLLRNRAQ